MHNQRLNDHRSHFYRHKNRSFDVATARTKLVLSVWSVLSIICAVSLYGPGFQPAEAKGTSHAQKRRSSGPAPVDQLYEYPGGQPSFSSILNVLGTPGYVVTASGPTRGIYCRAVHVGGLAYQFGLQSGDMLLSMNGRSLSTLQQADQYLQSLSPMQVQATFAHPEVNRVAIYSARCPFAGFKDGTRVDSTSRLQYREYSRQNQPNRAGRVQTY